MHPALIPLDPLFKAYVKLFIKDIHALQAVEDAPIELYHFYDHVIKFVSITGIIVGVETMSSQIVYTLDDSTATIACCLWNDKIYVNYKPLPIGTSVQVLGKLNTFRDEKQVIIEDLLVIFDPNQELLYFIETLRLRKEYAKPYKLPETYKKIGKTLTDYLDKVPPSLIKKEDQEQFINEKTLTDAIYRFIKKNYSDKRYFNHWSARDDEELKKMAIKVLQDNDIQPKDSKITDLIIKCFKSLVSRNQLLEAQHMDESWYTLPEEKDNVNLIVMKKIQNIQQQVPEVRTGVKLDYLQAELSSHPIYKDKKKNIENDLKQILANLMDKGYIYLSAYREYKLTFTG